MGPNQQFLNFLNNKKQNTFVISFGQQQNGFGHPQTSLNVKKHVRNAFWGPQVCFTYILSWLSIEKI
jgi:hypothetical protein